MKDLVIAILLLLLWLLWDKYRRLQQRLSVFEAAENHFCRGEFPSINPKMLERLQLKVGELFAKENYDSGNWQAAFDLFTDASFLINYWLALHPSEVRDAIDAVQQAESQQVVSHVAKRATIKALVQ